MYEPTVKIYYYEMSNAMVIQVSPAHELYHSKYQLLDICQSEI